MTELHFLRPLWVIAFVPLIALVMYLYKHNKKRSEWKNEVDAHLLSHILVSMTRLPIKRTYYQSWLIVVLFWTVTIIALAGPAWNKMPPIQIIPDNSALIVVLNLSRSMETQDIYPDRLKQAQYKLRLLLERMPERPVALVVYSAQAHSVMPLTQDTRLITHLLEYMTPDIMPAQGSNTGSALLLASNILSKNNSKNGQILLVTDSIDEQAFNTMNQLSSLDLNLMVYAVASKKNRGNIVSVLDEQVLIQLEQYDAGYYQKITNDDTDIRNLLEKMNTGHFSSLELAQTELPNIDKAELQEDTIQIWYDRGAWLIILLLPPALLLFRPGVLSIFLPGMICCFCCFSPVPAEANAWQRLWYNSNELGSRALNENDPEQAEQLFFSPFWQGIAQYRQKKYTQALASFSSVNSSDSFYNKGNTLVHLKRYHEAIQAYNIAIQMKSAFSEAKINLQLVEKHLQQNESKEQSKKKFYNLSNKKKNNKTSALDVKEKSLEETDDVQKIKAYQKNEEGKNKKTASSTGPLKAAKQKKKNDAGKPAVNKKQSELSDKLAQNKNDNKAIQSEPETARKTANHKKTVADNKKEVISSSMPFNKNLTNQQLDNDKAEKSVNLAAEAAEIIEKTHSTAAQKSMQLNNREVIDDFEKNNMKNNTPTASEKKELTDYKQLQLQRNLKNEQFQSLEHWLDSIQDDPSELLREKFKREYKKSLNAAKDRLSK